MSEVINTNLEKLFFAKILEESAQFHKVEETFFENQQIRLIFTVIKNYYIESSEKIVPSPKQIWAMVQLNDSQKIVTRESFRALFMESTHEISAEWLDKKFKAWKSSKYTRQAIYESIDIIKGMEEIDYDNVMDIVGRLKTKFAEIDTVSNDDEDLGDDFDDPETHKQNVSMRKMPSGWGCFDKVMGGGWDHATFNVIMGETNVGKSMWLQNISANLADSGYNVLFITLEMAKYKCMKRLGAMRLKIDINQYDELSKDSTFMKNKINQLKTVAPSKTMFDGAKPGKIFVKKYPTSDCTITDLENFIKKFEEVRGIKIDAIVIDYISIMSIEKGSGLDTMLFLKGKHLAEGLRRIGDKYDMAVITATQVDKSVWGANDINLDDIPESKAIAESADSVWAIIRNSEMKKQNKYRLKILKLRDGEHHEEQISFDFNNKYLTMDNDVLWGV